MIESLGWFPSPQSFHNLQDIHPAAGAENSIQPGNFSSNLLTITLGKASGSNDFLTRFLAACQPAQFLKRFFARWLDKSARIDNQEFRLAGAIHGLVPRASQQSHHGRRINGIFCTAQGNKIVRLWFHRFYGMYGVIVGVTGVAVGCKVEVGIWVGARVAVNCGVAVRI